MNILFRSAAATTEQQIFDGRCRLIGVYPEAATAAGTITLRNDNSLVPLTPTTPAAVIAAGGSLPDDQYFYMIVGVDKHGELTAPSTEVNATTSGANNSVGLSWDVMDNTSSYRIYWGLTTGRANLDKYFTSTTNSYTHTSTSGATTAAGGPSATSTMTSATKHVCAAALSARGKDFDGAQFDTGLTVQLSSAERVGVVYEPISSRNTAIYGQPG